MGVLCVGAVYGLAVVAKGELGEAFRKAGDLCAFGPGIAVAVERDAVDAEAMASFPVETPAFALRATARQPSDSDGRPAQPKPCRLPREMPSFARPAEGSLSPPLRCGEGWRRGPESAGFYRDCSLKMADFQR